MICRWNSFIYLLVFFHLANALSKMTCIAFNVYIYFIMQCISQIDAFPKWLTLHWRFFLFIFFIYFFFYLFFYFLFFFLFIFLFYLINFLLFLFNLFNLILFYFFILFFYIYLIFFIKFDFDLDCNQGIHLVTLYLF